MCFLKPKIKLQSSRISRRHWNLTTVIFLVASNFEFKKEQNVFHMYFLLVMISTVMVHAHNTKKITTGIKCFFNLNLKQQKQLIYPVHIFSMPTSFIETKWDNMVKNWSKWHYLQTLLAVSTYILPSLFLGCLYTPWWYDACY